MEVKGKQYLDTNCEGLEEKGQRRDRSVTCSYVFVDQLITSAVSVITYSLDPVQGLTVTHDVMWTCLPAS